MLQLNPLISLISTSVNDKGKLDWINTSSFLQLPLVVPSIFSKNPLLDVLTCSAI